MIKLPWPPLVFALVCLPYIHYILLLLVALTTRLTVVEGHKFNWIVLLEKKQITNAQFLHLQGRQNDA